MAFFNELQLEGIPSHLISAFIQQAARLDNGRLALVGGVVRDSLLSIASLTVSKLVRRAFTFSTMDSK